MKTTITDANGKEVISKETQIVDSVVNQPLKIDRPQLWDGKKNPYLYNVVVELYDGTILKDKVVQRTGFRYFKVDPDKGFFLNGKYLNLYGFCRKGKRFVAGRLSDGYGIDKRSWCYGYAFGSLSTCGTYV